MAYRNSAPVVLAVIFLCGLIALFSALKSAGLAPEGEGGRGILAGAGNPGGFAMLSVDESCSDREIGEALSRAGITGYISESGSWVFLDDFGELKRVALDIYGETVEPFDPRNDGYAEALRSFFVKDGKRRVFIDLNPMAFDHLKDRAGAALGGDTAFTLDAFVTARRGPLFSLLLLFFAAGGGVLFLALKNPGTFPAGFFRMAAALIPAQLALAFSGPGGFACIAALFGCTESLVPPLRENLARFRRPARFFKFDRIFRVNWVLALVFFLVYIAAAAAAPVPPLPAVLAGAASFTALVFFLRLESAPAGGFAHRRFLPIPIRQPSFSPDFLPRMTLPFALASCLSLFLPLLGLPGNGPGASPVVFAAVAGIPAREDYEAHFAFQSSFSLRPLDPRSPEAGMPQPPQAAAYYGYYLGEDGLIEGSRQAKDRAAPEYPAPPPFPLEELSSFLKEGGNYAPRGNGAGEVIAAAIVLLLALPSCFAQARERRKTGAFLIVNAKGDKQAAA
ncbi:MAG: hypothetical protein LBL20_04390 [Treponema sp.]|jgi:hypothetical protein|nr:hypothetical protein [Treponema sp.]